ncbi:MAG: D-alanine--D-alanine ligase, partial [Acetobacter sp.]|nr:D-alanine--D-alanine ligase [Acetobacter sp.]
GSSVGLSIVYSGSNTRNIAVQEWCFGETALVEEYIPGREISISVMADRALAITEIIPRQGHPAIYDYTAKYAINGSRHILPAQIDPSIARHAMHIAVTAHRVLGCSGASRADFRLDDTQKDHQRLVLLEVNTQPGMTETSLLPEQAAYCGISYPELCNWLVTHATCRQ